MELVGYHYHHHFSRHAFNTVVKPLAFTHMSVTQHCHAVAMAPATERARFLADEGSLSESTAWQSAAACRTPVFVASATDFDEVWREGLSWESDRARLR